MKLKILAILMALPFLTYSQSRCINKFFKKYKDQNTSISVSIPKWLVKSGAKVVSYSPAKAAMSMATKAKVMLIEDPKVLKVRHLRKLDRKMSRAHFEELITIQNHGEQVKLMQRIGSDGERHLFFNVIGEKSAFFATLSGKFDGKDVERIIEKMKTPMRSGDRL